MDTSKPDNIHSQPTERPPEGIQAHPPPPGIEPRPSPDYDFKVRSAWDELGNLLWVIWQELGTLITIVVLGGLFGLYLCIPDFSDYPPNRNKKTFSNVASAIQSTGWPDGYKTKRPPDTFPGEQSPPPDTPFKP